VRVCACVCARVRVCEEASGRVANRCVRACEEAIGRVANRCVRAKGAMRA
jgi:hypothetical protein